MTCRYLFIIPSGVLRGLDDIVIVLNNCNIAGILYRVLVSAGSAV